MIFHYFGSKLGMYEYLFEYSEKYIYTFYGDLEEKVEGLNFIERFQHLTKVKLQAYTENPYIFEFMAMTYLHPENNQISEKIKTIWDGLYTMRDEMLSTVDIPDNNTSFRKDLDLQRIKDYIAWVFDGYTKKLLAEIGSMPLADMNLDPYWEEFDNILEDLRKLFYEAK